MKVNYEKVVDYFTCDPELSGWPLLEQSSVGDFLKDFESEIVWDDDVSETEKRQMMFADKDFLLLYCKYLLVQYYQVQMNAAGEEHFGIQKKKKSKKVKTNDEPIVNIDELFTTD